MAQINESWIPLKGVATGCMEGGTASPSPAPLSHLFLYIPLSLCLPSTQSQVFISGWWAGTQRENTEGSIGSKSAQDFVSIVSWLLCVLAPGDVQHMCACMCVLQIGSCRCLHTEHKQSHLIIHTCVTLQASFVCNAMQIENRRGGGGGVGNKEVRERETTFSSLYIKWGSETKWWHSVRRLASNTDARGPLWCMCEMQQAFN